MRALHRWLATLGMVLFLYMTLTGTVLSIAEFRSGPTIIGPHGEEIAGPRTQLTAPPGSPPGTPPPSIGFVGVLKQLHSGGIVQHGEWATFAVGLLLITLSVTGGVMYLQLLFNRQRRGRRDWFWK